MDSVQVGQWRIRCGWAHHKTEAASALDSDTVDKADPANTNVYVGNLSTEVRLAADPIPVRAGAGGRCCPWQLSR